MAEGTCSTFSSGPSDTHATRRLGFLGLAREDLLGEPRLADTGDPDDGHQACAPSASLNRPHISVVATDQAPSRSGHVRRGTESRGGARSRAAAAVAAGAAACGRPGRRLRVLRGGSRSPEQCVSAPAPRTRRRLAICAGMLFSSTTSRGQTRSSSVALVTSARGARRGPAAYRRRARRARAALPPHTASVPMDTDQRFRRVSDPYGTTAARLTGAQSVPAIPWPPAAPLCAPSRDPDAVTNTPAAGAGPALRCRLGPVS